MEPTATLQPDLTANTTFSVAGKQRRWSIAQSLTFVDDDLNNHWVGLKMTWQESRDDVLGKRASNRKEWLSNQTWSLILQRKGVKEETNGCKEQARQRALTSRYWKLNNEVRKSARQTMLLRLKLRPEEIIRNN